MITVMGSLNIDLVTITDRFPTPGETIRGSGFSTVFGGKGANQAVAAARLGGQVKMVGKVGDDLYGESYIQHLKAENINVTRVSKESDYPTGTAAITVAEGDNQIIVVSGANGAVSKTYVNESLKDLEKGVLLVQLEVPDESVEEAMTIAKAQGMTVILNPAPFKPIPAEWWALADYITPNEHEAAALKADQNFKDEYKVKLVITYGSRGAAFIENGVETLIPAPEVEAVDTTGAGDTFNGALAVFLDKGFELRQAVEKAVQAASLSVTAAGAQGGMPYLKDLR
ncbi:ribokinase [Jeotgalibacillus malaysiensis]|uniref:Ribokinase n=1 Tax=Jeotgalibacillus malaysiensis TaxID=1508404 RepID=A0A0B5AW01_9BACL|nr:ribokinase [Jeotgalibacillus malaysiensis]AJD92867.1 ribokinase [Jeotgalibacillus malaysiensis]